MTKKRKQTYKYIKFPSVLITTGNYVTVLMYVVLKIHKVISVEKFTIEIRPEKFLSLARSAYGISAYNSQIPVPMCMSATWSTVLVE
jgi:hypothetical protein